MITFNKTNIRGTLLYFIGKVDEVVKTQQDIRISRRIHEALVYARPLGQDAHMGILRGHADDLRFLANLLPAKDFHRDAVLEMVDKALGLPVNTDIFADFQTSLFR